MQYLPHPGRVKASVELWFGGEQVTVNGFGFPVERSRQFGLLRAVETVEIYGVVFAAAAALLSGLLMFYVDSATFGSFKDYVTMLLWGVGADQTKNFIQQMGFFSTAALSAPNGEPIGAAE